MKNQKKAKDRFLEEIHTMEGKIQEIKDLTERNGARVEDLAKRARNDIDNFHKKMEAIEKMASKK